MGNKVISDDMSSLRYTVSSLLAMAVSNLYDDVKLGTGLAIEDGFYYDFGIKTNPSDKDLVKIENEMRRICKKVSAIEKEVVSYEKAKELFGSQPYKLELIEEYNSEGKELSIYKIDKFVDLCAGSHVEASELKKCEFKLFRASAAYWKGDAENDSLQRIYGTAFRSKDELEDYLKRVEEAKERDHRVLGTKMDLFSHSQTLGQGLVLWHPKGAMVRFLLERFSQNAHILNGYSWVYTPHIGRAELWETSGHLQFYKDSMYSPIIVDEEEYYLKPMSCPFHILIYNDSQKSYRDLPIRYSEYAAVYRYELSGALQGLTRVRGFTQDDAHIICTPEQMHKEVVRALKFSLYILKSFGLHDFTAYISTKPEKKCIGSEEEWNSAIEDLKAAVMEVGLDYDIDEGGGAFYGPKIDIKLNDSLGREWQCSTIQYDFNLPARFNMTYIGDDGEKHVPKMVHRALFGSLERFMAMLTEHYNGDFPFWLAPVQIGIVPIADRHIEFANELTEELKKAGIRVELDDGSERMNKKIRRFQESKVPYMFILGDKEVEDKKISIRSKSKGDLGTMSLEEFMEMMHPEIELGIPKYIGD